MKKLTKLLITLVIVSLLVFSAGCTFVIRDNTNNTGGNNNESVNGNYNASVDRFIPYIDGESATLINDAEFGVEFGNYSLSERKSFNGDYSAAYQAVSRACVAIQIKDAEGSVSAGSGTIVDVLDGNVLEYYILTAHHVIDGMGEITVYVPDASGLTATDAGYDEDYAFTGTIGNAIYANSQISLVGGDKQSDVAVLKLTLSQAQNTALDIVEAKLPASDYQMEVGEEVFAIGNPTGKLPGTLTIGNIAYLFRNTSVSGIGNMKLIQMNLDIWHGSSGGALFNEYGELIGITNAGNDENSGINFAIPYSQSADENVIDDGFVDVAKQLIATKNKYPNNYGFVSGHRQSFGMSTQNNANGDVAIVAVESGSLAEKAGLRINDIITKVNDVKVDGSLDCQDKVLAVKVGGKVRFFIVRGKESGTISIAVQQYRFCDTGLDLPVVAQ